MATSPRVLALIEKAKAAHAAQLLRKAAAAAKPLGQYGHFVQSGNLLKQRLRSRQRQKVI